MDSIVKCLLVTLLDMPALSCHEDEIVITINVDSEQKIPAAQGNVEGELTANSQFGSAIAVIGDLEADGVGDLVVGAPLQGNGGMDGTVKSRKKISGDAGRLSDLLTSGNQFGRSLANMGYLNKDGITDLAVGAPFDDDGGTDIGANFILYINYSSYISDFSCFIARQASATAASTVKTILAPPPRILVPSTIVARST